jgi:hypothetical protein
MTTQRTLRLIALKSLPPLPITIDYRHEKYWTIKIQNHMTSALTYPDHVCRIQVTILLSDTSLHKCSKKLLAAMNQPSPTLESLELHCLDIPKLGDSPSLPPFLIAPTLHLRHLKFSGSPSTLLCNILSCTTSVIDLTLSLSDVINSSLKIQLLAHL